MSDGLAGADAALKKLRGLDAKMGKKFLRAALRAGAKIVADRAKELAPVRSGLLRKNIKVRAGKSRGGNISVTAGLAKKYFTGKAFYAAFQEFGWKAGSRKLGNSRKQIEGRHFLQKAAEEKQQAAISSVVEKLKELVNGSDSE